MQHILEVYILWTCHQIAQIGPPIVCFHPTPNANYMLDMVNINKSPNKGCG
jgi:hypothetical protein